MPRNGSGTFTKVNTFTAATPITASGHNQNWDDLVTQMTNSVAADGQTTMTGPLKAASGTAAAPGIAFGSDPDTGMYRKAANTIGVSCGGVEVAEISADGITVGGNSIIPIGFVGYNAAGVPPNGWVFANGQSLLRASYPELFDAIGIAYGAVDGTHFSTPTLPSIGGTVAIIYAGSIV